MVSGMCGNGFAGYMYLLIAWEKLLQKPNTKLGKHIHTLFHALESS
jgi:hypothetical protein